MGCQVLWSICVVSARILQQRFARRNIFCSDMKRVNKRVIRHSINTLQAPPAWESRRIWISHAVSDYLKFSHLLTMYRSKFCSCTHIFSTSFFTILYTRTVIGSSIYCNAQYFILFYVFLVRIAAFGFARISWAGC